MTVSTCLLALAVLGSGEPTESGEPHVLIRVKSLEMKGVDWRGPAGSSLQPCARQGNATIWTTDEATAATIAKAAVKVIDAPKITTVPGSPASVVDEVNRNYVAEVLHHPGASLPFEPKIETVHDGWRGSLTCRPLDQGVLAGVKIDSTQFMAFHPVSTTERFRVDGSPVDHSFKAQYQVPEVVSSHVAGDWLIPKNGCLVIAFGVHTANNAEGKPSAVERVMLIQAEPFSPEPSPIAASPQLTVLPDLAFPTVAISPRQAARIDTHVGKTAHHPAYVPSSNTSNHREGLMAIAVTVAAPTTNPAVAPAPMPQLPSRAIPQAFSADGTPVEGPAMLSFMDHVIPLLSSIGDESAEPRPSPQSLHGLKDFALKTFAGITRADAAELLSLLRDQQDDELCPVDGDVKPTAATVRPTTPRTSESQIGGRTATFSNLPPTPSHVKSGVSRVSLGGGFVLEIPSKYLSPKADDCGE